MNQWLMDLRNMTEIECMSVLQGKPLQRPENKGSDPSAIVKEIKGELPNRFVNVLLDLIAKHKCVSLSISTQNYVIR